MPSLPMVNRNVNNFPHVVLAGAAGSGANLPDGDASGRKLPAMNNFVETLDLSSILHNAGIPCKNSDIKEIYTDLISDKEYESPAKPIIGGDFVPILATVARPVFYFWEEV